MSRVVGWAIWLVAVGLIPWFGQWPRSIVPAVLVCVAAALILGRGDDGRAAGR